MNALSNQAQQIQSVLDGCGNTPGFTGAVVATSDGLILASSGNLRGDTSAACAASLAVHTDAALGTLERAPPREALVWTQEAVWYLVRIEQAHVLLMRSGDGAHAGALRWTGQLAAARLAELLKAL